MLDNEIAQYGPVGASLLAAAEPGELGPGNPNQTFHDQLVRMTTATLFSAQPIVDDDMASCCESGLWLLHNYLDESHRISQEIHTPTGSYWHGIMHRREPDYSNAKYWFRQTSEHPCFESLNATARQIAGAQAVEAAASFLAEQDRWNPAAFVDLCEKVARGHSNCKTLCQEIAFAEWRLLFDYCFRAALGQ